VQAARLPEMHVALVQALVQQLPALQAPFVQGVLPDW
jgi:hypothetical protein